MSHVTLAALWESYRARVVPRTAPPVQVIETQKAFYAGALVMLETCKRIGEDDISEDTGVRILQGLSDEVDAFVRRQGES